MTTDYYNPERVKVAVEKIEAGLEWDIIAFDIYALDLWDHHAFFRSMEERCPGYEFMVAECNSPANSGAFTDEQQAEWLTAFLKNMNE